MKVTLTVELELPDDTPVEPGAFNESMSQLLFDEYVNYVTCQHLGDAVKWCARGKVGSDEEDVGAKLIYEHHAAWGEICSNAKWSFTVDPK